MKSRKSFVVPILLFLILSMVLIILVTSVEESNIINVEVDINIVYEKISIFSVLKNVHVDYVQVNLTIISREYPSFAPLLKGHVTYAKIKFSIFDGEILVLAYGEELIPCNADISGCFHYENVTWLDMDFNHTAYVILGFQVEGYISYFEVFDFPVLKKHLNLTGSEETFAYEK